MLFSSRSPSFGRVEQIISCIRTTAAAHSSPLDQIFWPCIAFLWFARLPSGRIWFLVFGCFSKVKSHKIRKAIWVTGGHHDENDNGASNPFLKMHSRNVFSIDATVRRVLSVLSATTLLEIEVWKHFFNKHDFLEKSRILFEQPMYRTVVHFSWPGVPSTVPSSITCFTNCYVTFIGNIFADFDTSGKNRWILPWLTIEIVLNNFLYTKS